MFVAVACLTILTQPFAYAMPGRKKDKEEKLIAKIEREKNPGKKARLQIRLAKLKLQQANAAYQKRDFVGGRVLLRQYLDEVKSSWDTLQDANNAIRKHVRAFMAVEMSLDSDDRLLEDMRRSVPYPESEAIKEIEEESRMVHSKVLDALFPAGFSRKVRRKRPMPPKSSVKTRVGAATS